jgi:hypothetical protein
MRLKEIAEKINAYLHKFEKDPKMSGPPGRSRFWGSMAYQAGRYVMIVYVSYQGASSLTREEAEKYLEFLDGGGKGKHYLCEK